MKNEWGNDMDKETHVVQRAPGEDFNKHQWFFANSYLSKPSFFHKWYKNLISLNGYFSV